MPTILKMWNVAPATSPFGVNAIGVPRIDFAIFCLASADRSEARVIVPLPAAHAFVAACAYSCAAT